MERFRQSMILALVGLLVLTAEAMAVARAAPDPQGMAVLCIGSDSVTVWVDEDGQPVAAPHICPDCILLMATVVPAAGAEARPARLTAAWFGPRGDRWQTLTIGKSGTARGPPRPA